jgi:hypothetical protein
MIAAELTADERAEFERRYRERVDDWRPILAAPPRPIGPLARIRRNQSERGASRLISGSGQPGSQPAERRDRASSRSRPQAHLLALVRELGHRWRSPKRACASVRPCSATTHEPPSHRSMSRTTPLTPEGRSVAGGEATILAVNREAGGHPPGPRRLHRTGTRARRTSPGTWIGRSTASAGRVLRPPGARGRRPERSQGANGEDGYPASRCATRSPGPGSTELCALLWVRGSSASWCAPRDRLLRQEHGPDAVRL